MIFLTLPALIFDPSSFYASDYEPGADGHRVQLVDGSMLAEIWAQLAFAFLPSDGKSGRIFGIRSQ